MTAKFEDLVNAINEAPNVFALSHLSLDTMKKGLADLQTRLQALERQRDQPPSTPFKGLGG